MSMAPLRLVILLGGVACAAQETLAALRGSIISTSVLMDDLMEEPTVDGDLESECMVQEFEGAAVSCIRARCGKHPRAEVPTCAAGMCVAELADISENCTSTALYCLSNYLPADGPFTQEVIVDSLTTCFNDSAYMEREDDDKEEEEEETMECLEHALTHALGCVVMKCEGNATSMLGSCVEKCSDEFMMVPECWSYVECITGAMTMVGSITHSLIHETLGKCMEDGSMEDDDDKEEEPECMKSSFEPALGCVDMVCRGQDISMIGFCKENCNNYFTMIPPECGGYIDCMGAAFPMYGSITRGLLDETLAMCLEKGPMKDDDDDEDEKEEPQCRKSSFEPALGCVDMACRGQDISMIGFCKENCNSYFTGIPECEGYIDCMGASFPMEGKITRSLLNETLAACFEKGPMEDDDDDEEEEPDCMGTGFEEAFGCMFTKCRGENMSIIESCAKNCSNHHFNETWAKCFEKGPMEDDDDGEKMPECFKAAYNGAFGCIVADCGAQMISNQHTSMMESCSKNCSNYFFNESLVMCLQDGPMEDDDDDTDVKCMPEMVEAPLSCVLAKCHGQDSMMMLSTCEEWCRDEFDMLPGSCDPSGECFHEFVYSQPYGTPITDELFMEAVEMCFPCWKAGSHVMIVPGSRYASETDSCAFLDKDICMGRTGWSKIVFENGFMEEYEFEDLQLCERANFSSSAKKELLFEAAGDSMMYDFYWPGWSNKGYFASTNNDGTSGVPDASGKLPAYDSMCLAGLRLKDASGAFAEYELTPNFTGLSLVQIVQNCSMSSMSRRLHHSPAPGNGSSNPDDGIPDMDMCSMVGKLKMSKDLPFVSEALQVYAQKATGSAVFSPVWYGEWAFGTSSANTAFAGTVSIEGVPALDLLFSAYGGSWDFNNQWPGWFQEGPYYSQSHGKLPAFDHKPLTVLRFADDKGRFAEYSLNEPYSGMSLLEIVQKCMPESKRERRNHGGQAWTSGHCTDVGVLTASKGLEEVSQVLRIGVGDGTHDQNWRDWVVFMPVEGNGDGDFLRANTWAFGSKGETNTGNNDGPVYIYGGPSTGCVDKEEKCWLSGTRVMIVPGNSKWGDTYSCATLPVDVCEWDEDWTYVMFEDGYYSLYAYEDLQACQALPGSTNFEELLFNASGWDWTFNNQFEGWFNWPEHGMPSPMSTSMDNGVATAGYESQGFVWDLYKTMCLNGVKFADKSGTFVSYKLGDDYVGKSLLQIVQECISEEKINRRNDGTPRWNEGHCANVGYLREFAGRDDFANLRIGVGDGMVGDLRDWTVFMPIHGNGNGDFLWPKGNSWSFGSKGRTNPAFQDEVYIYGYPDVVKLVGFDNCDLKNSWGGWYQSGSYGNNESYGKQLAYDELPLQVIRFQDDDGNFAEYDLEYTMFEGKTLLEIVQYCMPMPAEGNWGSGWCQVGRLRRFGGPALVSLPPSLNIGLAFASGMMDDWALFTPQGVDPTSPSFVMENVWAFGTNCAAGTTQQPSRKMSIWGYSGMCNRPTQVQVSGGP